MFNAYREYWNNITTMNASATRAQYWWPQLINYLVLGIYSAITGVYRYIEVTPNDGTIIKEWNTVTIIFFLLTALIWLANFTVRARRLHDRDHSNWWILFYLLPFIGTLVIFITLILPSKKSHKMASKSIRNLICWFRLADYLKSENRT
ncbi:membrane protein [Enterococcus faecalis]|uniref:Membrane protein n=1 Tax=Enterococcus faecalis TaxID=1351 RepID=A0AC59HSK3_ENTFL|nr:membrane protein [Enterococcus faecalis]